MLQCCWFDNREDIQHVTKQFSKAGSPSCHPTDRNTNYNNNYHVKIRQWVRLWNITAVEIYRFLLHYNNQQHKTSVMYEQFQCLKTCQSKKRHSNVWLHLIKSSWKQAEDERMQTSSITVANGRPLNNKVPWPNNENLEETSVVINKWLNNTWWFNIGKTRLIEYNCHLTTQHSNDK